jgi:3-hydroxy-9,10-secoandrosta-1,3,5(10)-triene-9,17-dione monooxygenase
VQPAHYGGHELELADHYRLIMELARGCGSTGWVYAVLSGHSAAIALYPKEAQEEVWGADAAALASSSLIPAGQVERTEGGYRLRGRWRYSSGCDFADWTLLGGVAPGETPRMMLFLAPLASVSIEDDWFVLGMEATGSKALVVDGLVVPEHRALALGEAPGLGLHRNPIYRAPLDVAHNILSAVLVGIADGAVEEFVVLARERVRMGQRLAQSEAVQLAVAESAAEVQAARLLLLDAGRRVVERLQAGPLDPLDVQAVRRDSCFAARLSVRAVDRLHAVLGGSAIFDDNPLAASFRDVHAGAAHVTQGFQMGAAPYGRMLLSG